MNLPGKIVVSLFLFGILLGIALSPWASQKPQAIFSSPVNTSFAENISPRDSSDSMDQNTSTIRLLFAKFDLEQERMNLPVISQVLGATTTGPVSNKSGAITIAVVGDSMVDTMGTNLPFLEKALKQYYPYIKFTLLNYGIGAQNAVKASERINSAYSYKDRNYPKITEAKADIIIVESFAYNPLTESEADINSYKNALTSIVQTARSSKARVVFLSTISPLKKDFGKGPGGVNWDQDTAWNHATKIQTYMDNGLRVALGLNLLVIDAYHATLQKNGEGVRQYVNTHDGIHPSEAGHTFVAQMIARKIAELKLI